MTSQQDKELSRILDKYAEHYFNEVEGFKSNHTLTKVEAIQALTSWKDKEVKTRETELLDSLYWMYSQYCSGGHDFMGAGETASDLLENAGYIEADGAGRITKDNGDSYEQSLQSQGGK